MDLSKKLRELKDKQEALVKEYSQAIQETENTQLISENQSLKKELEELKTEYAKIKELHQNLANENSRIRLSLQEQIIDEKMNLIKISRSKLRIYFKGIESESKNRLSAMEEKYKKKIEDLQKKLNKELGDKNSELALELQAVQKKISARIQEKRESMAHENLGLKQEISEAYIQLENEKLDEATMQKRIKQNRIEMKIGLNWINKIGMVLILIGIGFAVRYGAAYLNNYIKGIAMFGLGGIMLGGGEWLYRKKKEVFALGLLGGGLAVLYGAVFYSYFLLHIIPLNTGLFLLVGVTITALVLSLRYDSQPLLTMTLIGGFLPFLTYISHVSLRPEAFFIAMAYLFILNLLLMIVAFLKQWRYTNIISFVLNTPAMIFLVTESPSYGLGLAYTILTFLMYLSVILSHPFKYKKPLKIVDLILLGVNTTVSAVMVFVLFDKMELNFLRGYLAMAYCGLYALLGSFMRRFMKNETGSVLLFYITALTFAVLMIPFQFGVEWLSMGWLVEGILLTVYGYKQNQKYLEKAGWGLTALCYLVFLLDEFFPFIDGYKGNWFMLKYSFVSIGLLLVFMVYQLDIYKNKINEFSFTGKIIRRFKYFNTANFYVYANIFILHYFHEWMENLGVHYMTKSFYEIIIFSAIAMVFGLFLTKVPLLFDRVMQVASRVFLIIADFSFMILLFAYPVAEGSHSSPALRWLSIAILLAYNFLILWSLRDLIIGFIKKKGMSVEFFPLSMGIILMANISALLIVHFNLGDYNLLISFVYLFLAIGSIIYGFAKKYLYIRLFGLGLTLFALAKLFFSDLDYLETGGKIVAYLGFGVLLLAISYIYQKISSKIENNRAGEE